MIRAERQWDQQGWSKAGPKPSSSLSVARLVLGPTARLC